MSFYTAYDFRDGESMTVRVLGDKEREGKIELVLIGTFFYAPSDCPSTAPEYDHCEVVESDCFVHQTLEDAIAEVNRSFSNVLKAEWDCFGPASLPAEGVEAV